MKHTVDDKVFCENFSVKRILWCSEPGWQNKETIDYYADTLKLLCDGDNVHVLELKVGGTITRMEITSPWKYL